MNTLPANDHHHRTLLRSIARRAMLERGLLPDFSSTVLAELDRIQTPTMNLNEESVRDQRDLLWSSIDNDDSNDIDQLTVAEELPGSAVRVLVAVADVVSIVKDRSAIDAHARHNTTSVYTAAETFPMLPERLSTDLTSLNLDEDRAAFVIEMVVGADGNLRASDIYQAYVRNHAKLAYNRVAAWLEGRSNKSEGISSVNEMGENLHVQERAAQSLRKKRYALGALSFETIEARPFFEGDQIRDLIVEKENRAKEMIEDFMIAANGVTARYLSSRMIPSIRRVVRKPKRWERIIELAKGLGFKLPDEPDSKALDEFLIKEKESDPLQFPDLSLAVIKLLGAGEYIAEIPGEAAPGHFSLAVKDYTHSTAPNRRYTDLITQRLLLSALQGTPAPYGFVELGKMAKHFTVQEDAANKVERQVEKSAAALLLETKIGEKFDAIVTGASEKGTWARLLNIPVEGKVEQGFKNMDVGDRVCVQLISVNIEKGFIDFRGCGTGI